MHHAELDPHLELHCSSINLSRLQNVVKMATCFTWSELPTRDPDTGNRTLAASVARSQVLAWRVANLVILSHVLYLILRILTKNANPVFFNAWFPFDLDNILGYSFVLILQVMNVITVRFVALAKYYRKMVATTSYSKKKRKRKDH